VITFDPDKREINLHKHGIDLVIAQEVLGGFTITREDRRTTYGEVRLQTLGEYNGLVVFVVHTPRATAEGTEADHIISVRKADRNETRIYWKNHPGGA